ncbi:MAG: SusD/RagB family nutrient-binding outer membrane lipoprotein [Draconibacterium sp.]|nr:SusD/RagB family nutrient-binding outer membrane lipoprotein [Draconibacterium sp.]
MPNGLNDEYYAAWSRANSAVPTAEFFAKNQPMFLMTASEIWLLRAELALDGIGSGNANDLFQTGIGLAMSQWKIDETGIQSFISTEKEATLYGDLNNSKKQIATQLWISFVPNAFESWSTIRRTGYPEIPVRTSETLSKGVTNGVMPSRILYPYTVEKAVNGENLQQAITNMGGDKIDIKLWWSKK